ncbi:flagellar hook-basal body complex protein [Pseudomonas caspiana]
MSFNVSISGIHAANKRLENAGNNIANVGTIGFKSSRTDFAALYPANYLGTGGHAIGSGVRLANVTQNFNEGTSITTHGRPLDMRIQGGGFFVVSDRGSLAYTRAGAFQKDAEDFVVDSEGGRLQGYGVNDKGEVMAGVRMDMKIDTSNMGPKSTTRISDTFNLDASRASLAQLPPFNPDNPATYTRMTSRTIQDQAVGSVAATDHELKQYFVKTDDNQWSMYVLIDGRNPIDPGSSSPLHVTLDKAADGTVRYSATSQNLKKVSNTELGLGGWVPAMQSGNKWVANGAASGGDVSLSLEDGAGSALDSADPVMVRSLPPFNPADPATYSVVFSNALFDSQGNQHELKRYFVKEGNNSWHMHVLVNDRNPSMPESAAPLTARLVFNGNGSLRSLTGSPGLQVQDGNSLQLTGWVPATVRDKGTRQEIWISNGANASDEGIAIDFSKVAQFNAPTSRTSQFGDGHAAGELSSFSVGRDGLLRAGFNNGLYRNIGQLMLASFANEQGLQPRSDTRWGETIASGVANYGTAGSGMLGSVLSGTLEASNVVLADELLELIQAQTAYQANSKAISTEVTLMQTLIQST